MFAMALSPYLAALVFQHGGATLTFAMLLALAATNLVLVGTLWWLRSICRPHESDV
jgi:hypothetical protein